MTIPALKDSIPTIPRKGDNMEKLLEAKKLLYCDLDDRNRAGEVFSEETMNLLIALCKDPELDLFLTQREKKRLISEVVDIVTQAIVENTGGITSAIIDTIKRSQ